MPADTDEQVDARLRPLRVLMAAYARVPEPRTIAAVGNAPMPASTERARLIDDADLVIRTNSFVVDDPAGPACQGRRTDVVLFSRLVPVTPSFFAGYRDRLYVLLEPMRMYGRAEMWPRSWPADLGFTVARNDALAIPLNEEIGLDWRTEQLAPTTGATAVWLAQRLFPSAEVRVAGISFIDRPDQTEWQHQWGDSVVVGPEHRIGAEAELMQRWRDAGRIRVLPAREEDA